jgi:aminopeptidase N
VIKAFMTSKVKNILLLIAGLVIISCQTTSTTHFDVETVTRGVSALRADGYFIFLPSTSLRIGTNTLEVRYSHPYSKTGEGFTRVKDAEDGRTYAYTNLTPYSANRVFPCFDQPDLKGSYSITADAPASWTLVSATRESGRKQVAPDRVVWTFPKTARFSANLISLAGGPFKVWESREGQIPLRLFARQSIAAYVPVEDWFTLTRQGLKFYGEYFNYPYPFKKFDQLLVPDFTWDGMENVGAVLFSEKFAKRGKRSRIERENLAETLLHEMAHQWFGDLVTMKWWNDVWLNESFATFMSFLAMQERTEFKNAWQIFYSVNKRWGYRDDQMPNTHPIESRVADTDHAFSNFDGISYGKATSTIKQLRFFVGERPFQLGVRDFISKNAFGNAALTDFIDAIQRHTTIPLQDWSNQWLKTAGLNRLEANYSCRNGKIESFKIMQGAPSNFPLLRDHRTRIALLRTTKNSLSVYRSQNVSYNAPAEIVSFKGTACPDLVHSNFGDEDYVKTVLDPRSLKTAQAHLSMIGDPLLRTMIWTSLWDSVRDGVLPVQEYLEVIYKNLGRETNFRTLDQVLISIYGDTNGRSASAIEYLPRENETDKSLRAKQVEHLESFLWQRVQKAPSGSELQLRWLDAYVLSAETADAVQKLSQLVRGQITLPGLRLDDRRWDIIVRINSLDATTGDELEKAELAKDTSASARLSSIAAEVSRPSMTAKKSWIEKILGKNELPAAPVRKALRNLFPRNQQDIRGEFSDQFFRNLPEVALKDDSRFQELYVHLGPFQCSQKSVSDIGNYLNTEPKLPSPMLNELLLLHEEDKKCLAARKRSREASGKHKVVTKP